MSLINEIPESFWTLFRSYNRDAYIEALMKINEEYEYNNYYLSRDVCIQVLSNYFSQRSLVAMKEEQETDADVLEPVATRVLNWLVRTRWLRRLEDYATGVTNIVIPDYTAVFLDAFERLSGEEEDTEIYIQNVYAILFSYRTDPRKNERLLNTALVNTKRLNKALQDMLHNMDKFFSSLLEQKFYGDLLKEHLEGYVEEVVRKKYHILKTSDNFYRYKTDIKIWLQEIREWQQLEPENLELVNQIDRGFDDIEHRIANMDREHTRYVRATVTRLNYLLSQEEDMRGMVVQILNGIAEDPDRRLKQTAEKLNFSHVDVLSEKSLYKRKKGRRAFLETLEADEEVTELSREDVLRLNRMKNRYSRQQIEAFIEEHMEDGKAEVTESFVSDEESFEKLILAYDYAGKKGSLYQVEESGEMIDNGAYRYPKIVFRRRRRNNMGGNE
jgi:hypothetical protein